MADVAELLASGGEAVTHYLLSRLPSHRSTHSPTFNIQRRPMVAVAVRSPRPALPAFGSVRPVVHL